MQTVAVGIAVTARSGEPGWIRATHHPEILAFARSSYDLQRQASTAVGATGPLDAETAGVA